MNEWHDAAALAELAEDAVFGTAVKGVPLALFRLDGEIFALHDLCPHGEARLSDGYVENGCVECPLHQGLIDIRSGAPRSAPITEAVRRYPARIAGDRVEVSL